MAAKIFGICKSYYYDLKNPAAQILGIIYASYAHNGKILLISKNFIARCVLALSLYCRAPIEGIVQFFDLVIGYHVPKGKIDTIRKQAAEKARLFDSKVPLEMVQEIASDEIFQQNQPVLTVIDLKTYYIPIIEATEDRTGETWCKVMQEKKAQGFAPQLNVSDKGSGLCKGIPAAFPGITMQPDVFHLLRDLGRELCAAERACLAGIGKSDRLGERLFRRNGHKEVQYNSFCEWIAMCRKVDSDLRQMDSLNILFEWLKEHMGFTGYAYEQNLHICEWILDEMSKNLIESIKLQKAICAFRRELPNVLSFLQRLRKQMEEKSKLYHVGLQDFELLYRQQHYPANSEENAQIEMRLYHKFGNRLAEARTDLKKMVNSARRASSMIENLNGRLRCFMDLKREIPKDFLILIKVFFNTKKAYRSRHEDWVGTSAIERLTGKQYPEFLDLVVGPMDYILQ